MIISHQGQQIYFNAYNVVLLLRVSKEGALLFPEQGCEEDADTAAQRATTKDENAVGGFPMVCEPVPEPIQIHGVFLSV
jgi:hypothetical protein